MPPLMVEEAKSGRSKCNLKACGEVIEKGELRIGSGAMMPGMEEYTYKWRHLCCFTKLQLKNCAGVEAVQGYDSLKKADRKVIDLMVAGELVGKEAVRGSTGSCGDSEKLLEVLASGADAPKEEAEGKKGKKKKDDDKAKKSEKKRKRASTPDDSTEEKKPKKAAKSPKKK